MLKTMVSRDASDLFIKPGSLPSLRVDGKVMVIDDSPVTEEFIKDVFNQVAQDRARRRFEEAGEVDVAYDLPEVGRFRTNVFRQKGEISFAFRHIKRTIPTLEELNLPAESLKHLGEKPRGLILITGVAGCGKSTTLAAILQHINKTQHKHIITIEDPIEYILSEDKSVIDQREIGLDTMDFASALKHVVRQSPDVILIGEMRDRETMEAGINAAETGHLVFSTLHTPSSIQTVERIINYFPPHQHNLIRLQLSMVLEGVMSQRLLVRKEGAGRVPAWELLLSTPTIRDILLEGRTQDLYGALRDSSFFGTCTFNQSLKTLYENNLISLEEALHAADSPDDLKLEIKGITRDVHR
jgi:twitching motility protein PilT